MRSQMWRTSIRSPGSSWARGPSERGSVVLQGGPSSRPRVHPPSAAGFQLPDLAAFCPNPSMKMVSA
eukprot:9230129-Heterocapsa_arctica.AAC.1